MAFTVPIELGYEFSVRAPFEQVFAVLSDVPESVSHFPNVAQLVDLGRGVYRWEMEKVGIGAASLQTIYASKYVSDAKKGTVTWTPVEGEGNARVGGSWKIVARRGSTAIELSIEGTVDVPLPSLTKSMVAPVVKAEFEKLVDRYVDNLIAEFGGEV